MTLRRFIIERAIPAIGSADRAALQAASKKSARSAREAVTQHPVGTFLRFRRPDVLRVPGDGTKPSFTSMRG